MKIETAEKESVAEPKEMDLCEECGYYYPLTYKLELDAHLCDLCYDLPIK